MWQEVSDTHDLHLGMVQKIGHHHRSTRRRNMIDDLLRKVGSAAEQGFHWAFDAGDVDRNKTIDFEVKAGAHGTKRIILPDPV